MQQIIIDLQEKFNIFNHKIIMTNHVNDLAANGFAKFKKLKSKVRQILKD